MIDISFLDKDINSTAKTAGLMCYQASVEAAMSPAATLNPKTALFDTGHHTTYQHGTQYLTFILDRIPVSFVTFGLHTHPFYNSSQRSGRYCLAMFEHINVSTYVQQLLSDSVDVSDSDLYHLIDWVQSGISLYHTLLPHATEFALYALRTERPNLKESALEITARRIAQEQCRMVISTIVPTGMLYSINVSALLAMIKSSGSPLIKNKLLRPMFYKAGLNTLFDYSLLDTAPEDIGPTVSLQFYTDTDVSIMTKPNVSNVSVIGELDRLCDMVEHCHEITTSNSPIDTLQFDQVLNRDDSPLIKSELTISLATYSQEQRHRTMSRTTPELTNRFYVPPLLAHSSKIQRQCRDVYSAYKRLVSELGIDTMLYFAPYGTVVSYTRTANIQSWYHAVRKRTCLNAQEEIYHLTNEEINALPVSIKQFATPACVNGKCGEGKRYCGRDITSEVDRVYL